VYVCVYFVLKGGRGRGSVKQSGDAGRVVVPLPFDSGGGVTLLLEKNDDRGVNEAISPVQPHLNTKKGAANDWTRRMKWHGQGNLASGPGSERHFPLRSSAFGQPHDKRTDVQMRH
jgi:hypothetical protein